MKLKAVFIALSAITLLCSCGSGGSSPATQPSPKVRYSDPTDPTSIATCPLSELAGHYKTTQTSCSNEGRSEAQPDFDAVPMEYTVSIKGKTGSLGLIFLDANGRKKSESAFSIPRTATMADFKRHGIQCGNTTGSRSVTHNCPSSDESCSYSLLEHGSGFIGVYYRLTNGKLYACRSELVRTP